MTATANRARGHAWQVHIRRLMPQLRARADDLCELCGAPLDFDAPARSRRAPSVDHVVPLHAGGNPLPPLDELRLVHVGCNARRGNRTRRRGARPIVPIVPVAPAVELREPAQPRARQYELPRRGYSGHALDNHPRLLDEPELAALDCTHRRSRRAF